MTTKDDREEALSFYYKNATCAQKEWVVSGLNPKESGVDSDILELSELLSKYRESAETRGFLKGLRQVTKSQIKSAP